MKKVNVINSIMFSVFLIAFAVINILTPIKTFSEMENRYLTQLPTFNLRNLRLGRFTQGLESFVTDQFFLRDHWVLLKSDIERISLKRENNGIFIGKKGYLLENFKGPTRFFDSNIKRINDFSGMFPEYNVFFMLVPNSVGIYPEYLPPFATPYNQQEIIDTVGKNLSEQIKFINVKPTLMANKDKYIYFKTDHHWTMEGAYYAYRYAAEYLGFEPVSLDDLSRVIASDDFLGTYYSKANNRHTKADRLEVFKRKTPFQITINFKGSNKTSDSLFFDNHLQTRDKYSYFLDGNHPLVTIKTDVDTDKKILIAKDSYAHTLIPFLVSHYSEIHIVDLRHFKENLADYMAEAEIADVLFLYNISSFSQERDIIDIRF